MGDGRHPSRRAVVAVLAAVVAIAAVAVAWRRAGTSTPVPEGVAVAEFRAQGDTPGSTGGDVPLPDPGVYTFRATGAERGNVGPLHIDRQVPAEARYVVRRVPGGFTAELRLSGEHTEAVRYRVDAAGVHAVWRRVDVRFLGIGRDDRRPLRPAVLVVPPHPRVGMRWDATHMVWKLRTVATSAVTGRQRVEVGGVAVPTVVIETRGHTEGAHGGPRVERLWWSPRLAMPVRIVSDTTLGGPVGYRSRLRLELTSATPAR